MIGAIIQARMGSERLPGKMLMEIAGVSMMRRVIQRVKKSGIDTIVVDVPKDRDNRKLAQEALKEDVYVYLGSDERDVLADFVDIAQEHQMQSIVRITGDCPCIDPGLIDQTVRAHIGHRCQPVMYAITAFLEIDGLDIEVFDNNTLLFANDSTIDEHRQHVTSSLYGRPKTVSEMLLGFDDKPDAKLSVDIQEDFDRVVDIYETLGEDFDLELLIEKFGCYDNGRNGQPRNRTDKTSTGIWTP